MRISTESIKVLQAILKEYFGLEYTEEEAQQAGFAILRFVAAKQLRQKELASKVRKEAINE